MKTLELLNKVMKWRDWATIMFFGTSLSLIMLSILLFAYEFLNPTGYVRLYEPNQLISGFEFLWMLVSLFIGIRLVVVMYKIKLREMKLALI